MRLCKPPVQLWVSVPLALLGFLLLSGTIAPLPNSHPLASHTLEPPGKPGPAHSAREPRLVKSFGKLPLGFEANLGQTDARVKFLSRGRGYSLFLTGDEAVLSLRGEGQKSKVKGQKSKLEDRWLGVPRQLVQPLDLAADNGGRAANKFFAPLIQNPKSQIQNLPAPNPESLIPAALRLKLVGANPKAKVVGLEKLPGKSNYFIGNDPKKWRTNVPNYARVMLKDVYPGIDQVFYGREGELEYDFVVHPGADPKAIAWEIETGNSKLETGNSKIETGNSKIENRQSKIENPKSRLGEPPPLQIDAHGDLVIPLGGTDAGEVRFHKPVVYQEQSTVDSRELKGKSGRAQRTKDKGPRTTDVVNPKSKITNPKSVGGRYTLVAKNQVAFEVGPYDRSQPLIIDPVLSYSTYLGGNGGDLGYGIAVDSSGNAYVTGFTSSTNFPTLNPLQPRRRGDFDVFVAKLDASGSALVYSTYLGGTNYEDGFGIAVDSSGNAYVTGYTASADFPTLNPLQPAPGSYIDAFVAKLDAAGSALVYSTYLGGNLDDYGNSIAVDSSGNAYVTGFTYSNHFPTLNPLQPALRGFSDAFVAKLDAAGSALVYSTYLGGSSDRYPLGDRGNAIAVDNSGSAYVTGDATSTDFPTLNPLQPAYGGNTDAFVAKVDPAGSALVFSTYFGGSDYDWPSGIAVDSSGNAYVTGYTGSTDFPTMNALQPVLGGGGDAFIAKIDAVGSALLFSTYLGGSGGDGASGIAVDSLGDAYVTGDTNSTDFPTLNPLQPSFRGGYGDAFLAKVDPAAGALVYSTYFGGSGDDYAYAIGVDTSGNAYVTGLTTSTDFPTLNPLQPSNRGYADVFVAKVSPLDIAEVSLTPTSLSFGDRVVGTTSPRRTVTVRNYGSALLTIFSISVGGQNPGDFAQTNDCDGGLTGGGTCSIRVTFTPTTTGARSGTLTIDDDAPGSPHAAILSGNGIAPAVTLSATSLTFADQIVGTTGPAQAVTLTNSGIGPLTISGIVADGDFAQTNNCGTTVAEGASCTINVIFGPTLPGPRTGTVTISDNAPGSPQIIYLAGNGIGSTLNFTSTSLTFADQLVGTTSPTQIVTLTNAGPGPVAISSIVKAGDFGEVSNCPLSPLTLAASASCQFNVTFNPTATGNRTGAITITDNALGSPHVISLAGTGIAPAVNLAPAGLNFPDQTIGVPSPSQPVALSNTGSAALTINGIVASSNFGQTNNCGTSLAAGASCTINVTFTAGVTGTTFGSLSILDSAQGSPHVVSLVGTTAVSFADQAVGQPSAPQPLTLSNMSTTPRVISGITTTGDFAKSGACGTIQPGASCSVGVTFTPTAPGTRTGALVVADNAPGSPHAMTLTGIGIGPGVSFSANPLSFGGEILGTTSGPKTVTINNSGNQPLSITNIAVSGDYAQAASTCTLPQTLAPGTGCSVDIAFTPTAMGDRPGAVTVTDNAAGSPHTAALTGKGTDFAVATASGGSTSANVTAGGTATYRLSIAPTGFVGTVALACTGAPPRATCAPSLSSVMLDGVNPSSFTIIVKTTARAVAPPEVGASRWNRDGLRAPRFEIAGRRPALQPGAGRHEGLPLQVWLMALMLSLGLVAAWRRRGQVRDLPLQWRRPIGPSLLAAMLLLVLAWSACGGGGGGGGGGGNTGTPPGTYSLTVTATASGVSRSMSLSLVVN